MSEAAGPERVRPWHRIEALAAGTMLAVFRALPPARASTLGGALGRTIGTLLPVSRVADDNLQLALPGLDRATRRRVIAGVWDNLGRTVAEFPHLSRLRRNTPSGPGWLVEGGEILRAQAKRAALCCSARRISATGRCCRRRWLSSACRSPRSIAPRPSRWSMR